jgi:PIN domain nuclease of toxin-antitoxin system
VISTVNLAEVATKLNDLGAVAEEVRVLLASLHLAVARLDETTAFAAGALRAATRVHGLSLGDRTCLALAAERGAAALTTDMTWRDAGPLAGVTVELLR